VGSIGEPCLIKRTLSFSTMLLFAEGRLPVGPFSQVPPAILLTVSLVRFLPPGELQYVHTAPVEMSLVYIIEPPVRSNVYVVPS